MLLLCERPAPAAVDYETSRFVVSVHNGLNLGDRIIPMGGEVPAGALPPRALQLEYQCHRIETFEYASKVDELREACALRGTDLGSAAGASQPAAPEIDVESMPHRELVDFCKTNALNPSGSKQQLRDRVATYLARY